MSKIKDTLLQQPRLFYFIFVVEILARTSYYGMMSVLATYAASSLGFSTDAAHHLLGTLLILLFLPLFLGGYINDRLMGEKNGMAIGGGLLCCGYALLALPNIHTFYLALSAIITGNLFFNVAPPSLLAKYIEEKKKTFTDGIFTLYYMTVSIGAFVGVVMFPHIAKAYGYDTAFSLCALGLTVALIMLIVFNETLSRTASCHRSNNVFFMIFAIAVGFVVILYFALQSTPLLDVLYVVLAILAGSFFLKQILREKALVRVRLIVAGILIVEALIYLIPSWYPPFTLTFFATNFANTRIFGFEINHDFFQLLNSFWIFLFSPVLAYLYNILGRKDRDPNITTKFALGIILYGCGFLLIAISHYFKADDGLISGNWVAIAYLFSTLGELLISALGLAMIAKLVQPASFGLMMGFWYLTVPISMLVGQHLPEMFTYTQSSVSSVNALELYSKQFLMLSVVIVALGLVLLLVSEKLKEVIALSQKVDKTERQSLQLTQSLSNKLSKKASGYFLVTSLVIFIAILVANHQMSMQMYSNQMKIWLTHFSQSAVKPLEFNDDESIQAEVSALQVSKLFSSFIVLNQNQQVISAFGDRQYSILSIANDKIENPVNIQGNYLYPIFNEHRQIVGYYGYRTDYNDYFMPFLWLTMICLMIILCLYFVFKAVLHYDFKNELSKFGSFLSKIEILTQKIKSEGAVINMEALEAEPSEEEAKTNRIFSSLVAEISRSYEQIEKITQEAERGRQKTKLHEMARRVAHDLNNYIFNLNDCIAQLKNITAREREELLALIQEITSMAENLLDNNETEISLGMIREVLKESPEMTLSLVNQLRKALRVAESKCATLGITLTLDIPDTLYGAFVRMDGSEFRRIIINLINNAAEAQPKSNRIAIIAAQRKGMVSMDIVDDGRGIPEKILGKLGREEITYGKHNGHGIGVFAAVTMIKKWGGEFHITSQESIGTTLSISLPMAPPPSWFISSVSLDKVEKIVIIDDDQAIHQKWKQKLSSRSIPIQDFYSPTEAIDYFAQQAIDDKTLFLVDYQYAGESLVGVDVITRLSIERHCILVTGRSDEQSVIRVCEKFGIKLLAKNMIDLIAVV